jgi:opacity protein-like surface antigen
MTILRVLVVMGALRGIASADTFTAGAAGGAALGEASGGETAGLFVHLDGAADWHPIAGVALGAEAQLWTVNTAWQDVLARVTLSTSASDSVRMYVRGGVGAAFLHSDDSDRSSPKVVGLAYAASCGLLVAAGQTWDIDIGLRYNHFAASSQTAPDGFMTKPEITAVSVGLGFDAVIW